MEVEIAPHIYYVGKLKARQQRNVLRRLLPLIPTVQSALSDASMAPASIGDTASAMAFELSAKSADDFAEAVGPLARAIAGMSDADCDYIFDTCFSVCKRKIATSGYQDILAGGELRYEDISLPDQMRLTFYVLKENFAGFFGAFPGQSSNAPSKA